MRGPAWVQHNFGQGMSDLDTVRAHALAVTQGASTQNVLARPDGKQSKTLLKVKALTMDDRHIDASASHAYWHSARITDRQRSLALQVRFGTLITRCRIALWRPSENLPQTCPLCGADKDTVGHRLGACTHPSVKNQICACHGHAVHAIAKEIRHGRLGNCAVLVDTAAECHERYRAFPESFLPTLPENMQTSRPDIA